MNKYEKAFKHLREHASFDTVDEMIDIKELVERATPQQVVEHEGMVCCPKCGRSVYMGVDRYCSVCGQAITNTKDFWRNGND